MITLLVLGAPSAIAQDKEDKAEIDKDSQAALTSLYASVPAAKALGAKATAILVFPKITKAGLGIGGQHGDGALMKGGARSPTTARAAGRLDSRPASRPMAT